MPTKPRGLPKKARMDPAVERILNNVKRANLKAIRAMNLMHKEFDIRRLDRLEPIERNNVLTELALDRPDLIPVIKKYKEKMAKKDKRK